MSSAWHFREFRPGDNASDPDFAKALFSKGAEGVLSRAIVREAVQNSLDARASKASAAKVRFALRTGSKAADSAQAKPFFEGIWAHLHADNSGLGARAPKTTEPIPFLVVEDFGTEGLTGSPAQWAPFGSEKNPFFLFFRALGRSGKEGEDRGRWGVGKFVFPLASRASCWFGYTVPLGSTDAMLMGRVVIKTHGSAVESFHPDGHWGYRPDPTGLVYPVTDGKALATFRKVFHLQRNAQPGLSVVVPWLASEITAPKLMRAVMSEYFLPILRGELDVVVDDNGLEMSINAASFQSHLHLIDDDTARQRVELALRVHTWTTDQLEQLPRRIQYDEMEWQESGVPEDMSTRASGKLANGEPIGVRVPIQVKPRDASPKATHVDVFLQRTASQARQRPLIVREGITISEEKTSALQGYTALVIVDDGALATLVGDAESPAHNELQYQLIKEKYVYAGKVLHLLRSVASSIIRTFERRSREDDPLMLAQFFPVATDDQAPAKATAKPVKRLGGGGEPVPEPPPARPARIRVTRVAGGFAVRGNPETMELPTEVSVRFAYEVRRGNPFKKYDALDCSLANGDLSVVAEGASFEVTATNRITIKPTEAAFNCVVTGFDEFRNVVVRAEAE